MTVLEVSLERLVRASGVDLRRSGKDLVGLCPFHDDRSPSLVVSPQKKLWHCLGACRAGGSVIDWMMRAEGVSFRHAVELLRDGIAPTAATRPRERSTVRRLPSPLAPDVDDAELLARVLAFFQETLRESPEALAYLERRRLHDPEAIECFQLGYANRTLGYRLPDKSRRAGAELRSRLERLFQSEGELQIASTGKDAATGRLVTHTYRVRGPVAIFLTTTALDVTPSSSPAACCSRSTRSTPRRGRSMRASAPARRSPASSRTRSASGC